MSADRWNEALEAAAKACRNEKFRAVSLTGEQYNNACDACADAILALREAAPGEQPVAWTTALALEFAKSAPLSFDVSPVNLWGEDGIPLYTHPGGQGHESSRSQSEDSSARESVADLPASPGPMVMVPMEVLNSAVATLEADGDEHGVARFLRAAADEKQ